MRGADVLVQALVAAGITRIFSLSGNQIMAVYDACLDTDIEIVHTRHEAACVFMADAYAQLTGEVGVCLVTAAPGAANTLGSLYTARMSESPIVLLTGDSPRALDGKGAFQELDQIAMTQALTKHSARASSAATLGTDFSFAVRTARSGRPGPVHLALPVDLLESNVNFNVPATSPVLSQLDFNRSLQPLAQNELERLIQLISPAKRPLFVCGPAMSATRAGLKLSQLSVAMDAPVIPMESPRGLKDPSLGDFASVLESADLVISLGKTIDFMLGYGASTRDTTARKWVVIDADPSEHERAQLNLAESLVLSMAANPVDVADQLIANHALTDQLLTSAEPSIQTQRRCWHEDVSRLIAKRASVSTQQTNAPDTSNLITSASLCAAVQCVIDQLDEDTVVISDGGEFGQWSQAGIKGTLRLINGPSGAIGGGLCYAIAASKAKPDAIVFAMMGDGTVGFHLSEFETAVREKTSFVVVIGNDERWNAEYLIQLRRFGSDRLIGCELSEARYDKAVEALGGYGECVSDLSELEAAIKRALDSGLPACVNVKMIGLPAPSV